MYAGSFPWFLFQFIYPDIWIKKKTLNPIHIRFVIRSWGHLFFVCVIFFFVVLFLFLLSFSLFFFFFFFFFFSKDLPNSWGMSKMLKISQKIFAPNQLITYTSALCSMARAGDWFPVYLRLIKFSYSLKLDIKLRG